MRGSSTEEIAAWKEYEHGDPSKALSQFLALVQSGQPFYLVVAARMYMEGRGTLKDYEKARELLEKAMAVGVPEAFMQRAALANIEGNRDAYVRLLIEAERRGQGAARYYLGQFYVDGKDLSKVKKGMELIRQACDEGYLGAKILMARILLRHPANALGFLRGFWLLVTASLRFAYLAFKNPYDERIR